MNILKTKKLFTYMVVGALVMALSISCKSNEDPNTKDEERTFASYAGAWWGKTDTDNPETKLFTINTDGSMIMHNEAVGEDVTVASTSIIKNSDTSYTATINDASSGMSGQLNFTFSSDTQGKFNLIGDGMNISRDITKI